LQVLVTQLAAKKSGYADVVYLDAKTDTYLEEVSSCNIFIVKGKKIKTPPLQVMALIQAHSHCLRTPRHAASYPADT
jgi:branched-subunit amino acid aminotransferase/4-amino-4-deoxychorismate lyase